MSLLMEALRKAEEAKRKIQNTNPDSASNFSLESAGNAEVAPVPVTPPSSETGFTLVDQEHDVTTDYIVDNFLRDEVDVKNTPENAEPVLRPVSAKPSRASVEELQNYLAATPELEETPPTPRDNAPPKTSPTVQQRAAGSVFAAKQKPVQSHTIRNLVFAMLAVIGIFAGWYFFSTSGSLQIDPALLNMDIANRSLSDELINAQPAVEAVQQNAESAIAIIDQDPNPVTDTGVAASPVTPAQQNDPPAAAISPDTETAAVSQPPSTPALPEEVAAEQATPGSEGPVTAAIQEDSILNATAATGPVAVLEISHSKGTNNNNQQLLDAYASLQAGNIAAASGLYQQVLAQLPNNRDALLGSAAIALREGKVSRAREFYSRLMQLNPKDPLARTGLLQTIQDIDPQQYEQELQRLLQQFPDVAPLSFALGNVYANQQRWNEAQSAYFNAFLFARRSNDAAINPDYAYNLAVSLEQINQPKAALDYYLQAQTLARDITPGFDVQALSRRISILEQQRP